jgi:hypothetical protein
MYRITAFWRRRWLATIVVLSIPGVAFAYVDPGTGAYVVQSIMALVATATFYVARPIRYFRSLLKQRKDRDSEDSADRPVT